MKHTLVITMMAIAVTVPRVADAQCVIAPLDHRSNQSIVVAFVGTVQDIERVPAGEIVTFAVSLVYKGQTDERVVVYFQKETLGDPEGIVGFGLAKSYLVLANRQTGQEREQFNLSRGGTDTLEVSPCRAYPSEWSEYVRQVLGGAKGHPPRTKR